MKSLRPKLGQVFELCGVAVRAPTAVQMVVAPPAAEPVGFSASPPARLFSSSAAAAADDGAAVSDAGGGLEDDVQTSSSSLLAALNLPDGYTELALKMAPAVRDLVVFNRDPSTVPVNELLAALGMPPVEPRAAPPSYPGLRSLALLNLLPKPTGTAADVLHEPNALPAAACARLREAVDAASFAAADSVDGCIDYQLNLSRSELELLIGAEAVRRVWAVATRALRRLRPGEYGEEEEEEHEAEQGELDQSSSTSSSSSSAAAQLLDAHEIFVRVYTPHTRPWFPFHKDRSELTVNVALSDDSGHKGGRLIAIYDGAVRAIERREGTATLHPSSLMHAVSRMVKGKRHALIIFFGRNKRIVAFNQEVKRMLNNASAPSKEAPAAAADGGSEEVVALS